MADDQLELIRLQLAMAFGQGAGSMLATPAALRFLLEHHSMVERAAKTWKASRYPFVELVRVLGQVSATRAAMDQSWQIDKKHVAESIETVMGPCPCVDAGPQLGA